MPETPFIAASHNLRGSVTSFAPGSVCYHSHVGCVYCHSMYYTYCMHVLYDMIIEYMHMCAAVHVAYDTHILYVHYILFHDFFIEDVQYVHT